MNNLEELQARAGQGDARSQYLLSQYCYQQGDSSGMIEWLRRAAAQQMPEALDALGFCHEKGMGLERDCAAAEDCYRQAAGLGSAQAAYRLAEILYKSDFGSARLEEACKYLRQALADDYILARRVAGMLLLLRSETRSGTLALLQQAAAAGDPVSQFNLGWLLLETDPSTARAWLEKAGSADYPLVDQALRRLPESAAAAGAETGNVDARTLPDLLTPETMLPVLPEGLEWQVYSEEPLIKVAYGALSLPECAYLIHAARPYMRRAEVISPDAGDPGTMKQTQESQVRTSDSTFLPLQVTDLIVHYIDRKLSMLTGIELACSEPFSVLHYRPGQEYKPHYDYFDPGLKVTETLLRDGGQRIASAVTYLNAVEAGGGTAFPDLDLKIPATPGSVLIFHNCDREGNIDPRSLHAGLPVIRGSKWAATKWYREQPTSYLKRV